MMSKKFIVYSIPFSCILINAHQQQVTTYLSPRSQSTNAARELLGFAHRINIPVTVEKPIKWAFILTPQVTRSFWPEHINQCLFDNQCLEHKTTFKVSGSRAAQRDPDDWLADYFGLPTDFVSKVRTKPCVKNVLVDVQGYAGLDFLKKGLYLTLHAPFMHTAWDMKLTETKISEGINNHEPGYFNDTGVERSALLNSLCTFITGSATPTLEDTTFQPLQHAKISACPLKKNQVAEIQTTIGYQIHNSEKWYLDVFGRMNIPAGTRPKGDYLFEPIIGNGHHWEVGIGASAFVRAWHNELTRERVMLYAYAAVNHLFSTKQCRIFDLQCKPLSRYMLAQKMSSPLEQNLTGITRQPSAQFKREFAPVANLTALTVTVHAAYQAEFALMFEYTKERFSWLIGYDLWTRSAEKIKRCDSSPLDTSSWALKGDAHVIGFQEGTSNPIALSASQKEATISAGTNFGSRGNLSATQIEQGRRNPTIDNPEAAFTGATVVTATPAGNPTTDQIQTSVDPIFISAHDIDLASARTKALSHTIFAQVQRTWIDRAHFTPYIGFGAQIEFGPTAANVHSREIPPTINGALGNWGIWFKMGISYQ